jgi:hypothetical protein
MSEPFFRFITALASPLITLSEKIHKYQEKKETKEQFATALREDVHIEDFSTNDICRFNLL